MSDNNNNNNNHPIPNQGPGLPPRDPHSAGLLPIIRTLRSQVRTSIYILIENEATNAAQSLRLASTPNNNATTNTVDARDSEEFRAAGVQGRAQARAAAAAADAAPPPSHDTTSHGARNGNDTNDTTLRVVSPGKCYFIIIILLLLLLH